jgi:hypothetical protein
VGADVINSNIDVINGIRVDQVMKLTNILSAQVYAVSQERQLALAQAADLGHKLQVTTDAVIVFFGIVGEGNVSPDDYKPRLIKIATAFVTARSTLAALEPDDPAAIKMVEQAQSALELGKFQQADLLLEAPENIEIAAAHSAQFLLEKAHGAATQRFLNAAADRAARGDIALAQLQYSKAAAYFKLRLSGTFRPTGCQR